MRKMHVSEYAEYIQHEDNTRKWLVERNSSVEYHDIEMTDMEEKRQKLFLEFPFGVLVQGVYPELDNACRWCWQNVSPMKGRCEYQHGSEYPGCPLVLATEYITEGSYTDKDGKKWDWKDKNYKKVEPHEHEGNWVCYFLGKTGYDYGFQEFYFKNKADRDAFEKAVPTIGLGERYEN
jgi:hypothetical protein